MSTPCKFTFIKDSGKIEFTVACRFGRMDICNRAIYGVQRTVPGRGDSSVNDLSLAIIKGEFLNIGVRNVNCTLL